LRRRTDVVVVASSLLALGLSLLQLSRMVPSELPTIEQTLPAPAAAEAAAVRTLGGGGSELALVTLTSAQPPADERLREIEVALARLPGVVRTWSAASRLRLELSPDAAEGFRLVTAPAPTTARSRLDAFLSPAPNARVILLGLAPRTAELSAARVFWSALEEALHRLHRPGEELRACGTAGLRVASWRQAAADGGRLLPFLMAAVILVPLVCFRSLTAALFPLVLSALATAVTMLLYRQVHGGLDPWILVLVPLCWSIASMDALHLYEAAQHQPVAAARRALWLPCLLTAGTTASSLLVLCLPGAPPLLQTFGLWGALGTAIAYALTFLLAGPMLRLFPPRPAAAWPRQIARLLVTGARRRAWLVRTAWLGLVLGSVWMAGRLRLAPKYPHIFTADHETSRNLQAIEDLLGSELAPLDLYLEATTPEGRAPRKLLAAALTLELYLRTLPETRLSLSAGTIIDEWLRHDPRAETLLASPRFAEVVARSRSTLDDPRLQSWLSLERGVARAQLLLAPVEFARKEELIGWLRHFADTMLPGYRLRLGGPGYLYHLAEREGVRGLYQSAAIDAVLLLAILTVVLRRARLVLAGLAGNLLPLVLLAGLMALFRIPWSLGLLALPVVVLGLAIDDTIHLLWPLRRSNVSSSAATGFARAVRSSGTAVVATGLLLAACLAALGRSGFQVNRELGVLLPAGLLLALLAELTLLPALLTSWRRR